MHANGIDYYGGTEDVDLTVEKRGSAMAGRLTVLVKRNKIVNRKK
jgi:hypothetical protein